MNIPNAEICGNEGIPEGYRFYYTEQEQDSNTIRILWGYNNYPRPEGVYANPETGKMYKIIHLWDDTKLKED